MQDVRAKTLPISVRCALGMIPPPAHGPRTESDAEGPCPSALRGGSRLVSLTRIRLTEHV